MTLLAITAIEVGKGIAYAAFGIAGAILALLFGLFLLVCLAVVVTS